MSIWEKILDLLKDEDISEIVSNGYNSFFLKKKGVYYKIGTDGVFKDNEEYLESAKNDLSKYISSPYPFKKYLFEGQLLYPTTDKSGNKMVIRARAHIALPPAGASPQITIAKKAEQLKTLEALERTGTFNSEIRSFLEAIVQAKKTTAILGATGAGKDLRGDTLIFTTEGFKKLREIEIGDIVFDDYHKETKVLNKYSPMDERQYELRLSNGSVFQAGMGHLWKVVDFRQTLSINSFTALSEESISSIEAGLMGKNSWENFESILAITKSDKLTSSIIRGFERRGVYNRKEVLSLLFEYNDLLKSEATIGGRGILYVPKLLSTEEMFEQGSENFAIKGAKNGEHEGEFYHINSIEELYGEDPSDYYCLEVDAPTHMFLIGEAMIPTHNTTFLESICREISDNERIGIAEDTPELSLKQPNTSYLNSVPWSPGFDPNDVATLSWVVQQFQRMRVDRLIVGETRGKEFADFLTAANSGIEGCFTTLHANTPTMGLTKMTSFAMKGEPGRDIRSINGEIATAIQVIVQLQKIGEKHRVTNITEITGVISSEADARPTVQELYRWMPSTDTWVRPGGPTEKFVDSFKAVGVNLLEIQKSPITTLREEDLRSG